jgi:hypothetical protein
MEGNDATVNQSSGEREPSIMSHGNLACEDPEVEIGQQLKDSTTGKLLAMTKMLSSYPRQAARDELEMLNVSERLLVNVYCFSLFFGENVEQAKEMPMDLTISSHDTRRERIVYHNVSW